MTLNYTVSEQVKINKAIAYRKLKNRPLTTSLCKRPFFSQDLLFSLPGPGRWDYVSANLSAGNVRWLRLRPQPKSLLVWVEVTPPGTKNGQGLHRGDADVWLWKGTWAGWVRGSTLLRLWGWIKSQNTKSGAHPIKTMGLPTSAPLRTRAHWEGKASHFPPAKGHGCKVKGTGNKINPRETRWLHFLATWGFCQTPRLGIFACVQDITTRCLFLFLPPVSIDSSVS